MKAVPPCHGRRPTFEKKFPFSFRAEGREGGEGERDKEEEKITAGLFIPGRRWGGERDVGFLFAACCLKVFCMYTANVLVFSTNVLKTKVREMLLI